MDLTSKAEVFKGAAEVTFLLMKVTCNLYKKSGAEVVASVNPLQPRELAKVRTHAVFTWDESGLGMCLSV